MTENEEMLARLVAQLSDQGSDLIRAAIWSRSGR